MEKTFCGNCVELTVQGICDPNELQVIGDISSSEDGLLFREGVGVSPSKTEEVPNLLVGHFVYSLNKTKHRFVINPERKWKPCRGSQREKSLLNVYLIHKQKVIATIQSTPFQLRSLKRPKLTEDHTRNPEKKFRFMKTTSVEKLQPSSSLPVSQVLPKSKFFPSVQNSLPSITIQEYFRYSILLNNMELNQGVLGRTLFQPIISDSF